MKELVKPVFSYNICAKATVVQHKTGLNLTML